MYDRITLAEKMKSIPPTSGFSFGNIGDVLDTKLAAKYLQDKGLIGADQIKETQPNAADPNSIRNSQADWKISAIQHIMANAKRLKIKTPEAFDANMEALTSTLDPKYRQALKDPSFAIAHPNFKQTMKAILKDEVANDMSNSVAKK